jgi:glycosyltransferase involved in cell wall biosynthesis
MPETLTVVIPTKNAADYIDACLESVKWVDEIIVVDMASTDGTIDICNRYANVRLFQRPGEYIFANVNFGFETATSDWTMRLDSDERVTPGLAAQIQAVLRDPPPGVNGFFFRQRLIVLGHVLNYGRGLNSRREMMFRTGTTRYQVASEHEQLPTDETWQDLDGFYEHLNYASVSQYLTKTDYYTARDLERMAPVTLPPIRAGLIEPLRAMYLLYLKRRGFRDGWVGLFDAGMQATYQFVQWAKMRERCDSQSAAAPR